MGGAATGMVSWAASCFASFESSSDADGGSSFFGSTVFGAKLNEGALAGAGADAAFPSAFTAALLAGTPNEKPPDDVAGAFSSAFTAALLAGTPNEEPPDDVAGAFSSAFTAALLAGTPNEKPPDDAAADAAAPSSDDEVEEAPAKLNLSFCSGVDATGFAPLSSSSRAA